ncbi:MAG TPA: T9SS type A sorting domain-containing protein, partial [Chitinophagales bacterium]|nr:T9SS type A sorting domain-containing protein [Chitinophagales bacterium]
FSLVIAGFPAQTETENIASPERFLSINPNPITESICVQTELEVDRVIVYDNLGRRVGDLPKTSGQCFEWNTLLPKGIYYIQMYTSVGNFTKKIIAG